MFILWRVIHLFDQLATENTGIRNYMILVCLAVIFILFRVETSEKVSYLWVQLRERMMRTCYGWILFQNMKKRKCKHVGYICKIENVSAVTFPPSTFLWKSFCLMEVSTWTEQSYLLIRACDVTAGHHRFLRAGEGAAGGGGVWEKIPAGEPSQAEGREPESGIRSIQVGPHGHPGRGV